MLLQFFIYPQIAKKVTVEMFGLILTVIGLQKVISQTFGLSLSNLVLIKQGDKIDISIYNKIFLYSCIISTIIYVVGHICQFGNSNINYIILLVTIFSSTRLYLQVYFRLDLNYFKILISTIIYVVGQIVAILVFQYTNQWEIVFILPEISSTVYILKVIKFKSHSSIGQKVDRKVLKQYSDLVLAGLVTNIVIYMDRLLINPILGNEMVSIYYVATLTGKLLAMFITPINSVALSYLSKYRDYISKKMISKIIPGFFLVFIVSFFGLVWIANFLIPIIYSEIFIDVQPFLFGGTLASVLVVMFSTLQPLIMIKVEIKYLKWVNIVYLVVYAILVTILANIFSLTGFITATIISNILRIILGLLLLFIKPFNRKKFNLETTQIPDT